MNDPLSLQVLSLFNFQGVEKHPWVQKSYLFSYPCSLAVAGSAPLQLNSCFQIEGLFKILFNQTISFFVDESLSKLKRLLVIRYGFF